MNINNETNIADKWLFHFSPEIKDNQQINAVFWERAAIITTVALCVIAVSIVAIPFLTSSASLLAHYSNALPFFVIIGGQCLPPLFQHLENQKKISTDLIKKTDNLEAAHAEALKEGVVSELINTTFDSSTNPLSGKHVASLINNAESKLFAPVFSSIIHWTSQLKNLEKEKTIIENTIKAPLHSYLDTIISQTQQTTENISTIVEESTKEPSQGTPQLADFSLINHISNVCSDILNPFKETEDQRIARESLEIEDLKILQGYTKIWTDELKKLQSSLNTTSKLETDINSLENLILYFQEIQKNKNNSLALNKFLYDLTRELQAKQRTWKELVKLSDKDKENPLYTAIYTPLHELQEEILTAKLSILFSWTLLMCSKENLHTVFQTGMEKHGVNIENALYAFAKKKNFSVTDLPLANERMGTENVPLLILPKDKVITRSELENNAIFVTKELIDKLLTAMEDSKEGLAERFIFKAPVTDLSIPREEPEQ